jgi:methylated-DNA-[protein]-cysteine S-methyltransferase
VAACAPGISYSRMMNFTLFETAIGRCGMVWSARGIAGVQLPERSEAATRNRLLRRFPGARDGEPPAEVRRVIDDIVALLGGEKRDLSYVTIDIAAAPQFHCRVYEVARRIPAGATLSYGEVAERLGDRNLARDVAEALSQNPCPIIVPCHRILAAGGKPGGFSAPGGVATKLRLLTIEGAQPEGPSQSPMLFDRLPLAAARTRR